MSEKPFHLTAREKFSLVWRFLRGCVWLLVGGLLCAFLDTAFHALTPQIIRVTVDSILGDAPQRFLPAAWLAAMRADPLRALWLAAGAVLAAAAARGVFGFGQRRLFSAGSERFIKSMRDTLFEHIQHLSFAWHATHSTGDLIQRCTSDVMVVWQFVCQQLVQVIRTVFLIALYLYLMFRMDVPLTLLAIAFLPISGIASCVFYLGIASRFKAADEAESELTTVAQENLTGVRVVRAFGREAFEVKRFNEKNDRFSKLWIKLGGMLAVFWASGTFMTCLQVMAIIVAGCVRAVHGAITLGDFIAFIAYNESLAWPVRMLGRVLSDMSKAGVSIDRLGYILNAPRETDAPGALARKAEGDIVFEHVSFRYDTGPDVLKDVSFTVPQGSTFAILGGTGSGKSTLVHLLDRLYDLPPQNGRITIGGVPIEQFPREDLRRQIGLVLQEPFLFSRTIAENIAAARPDATREEIRRAAAIACVDDAIQEFPDGYDTLVGERGVTLSGGQKQRIAIARMLLQQAPIMIFDDSLSAVDAETDTAIRKALRENLRGSTVILISHRVTTLMQADKILVLDDGSVADIGTHAELISRPGIYRRIYEIQMNQDDRLLLEDDAPKPGAPKASGETKGGAA